MLAILSDETFTQDGATIFNVFRLSGYCVYSECVYSIHCGIKVSWKRREQFTTLAFNLVASWQVSPGLRSRIHLKPLQESLVPPASELHCGKGSPDLD